MEVKFRLLVVRLTNHGETYLEIYRILYALRF